MKKRIAILVALVLVVGSAALAVFWPGSTRSVTIVNTSEFTIAIRHNQSAATTVHTPASDTYRIAPASSLEVEYRRQDWMVFWRETVDDQTRNDLVLALDEHESLVISTIYTGDIIIEARGSAQISP